jgi:PIN domain nuclease of toxin-antitoxin system
MSSRGLLLDTHIVIWMATDPDRISLQLLDWIEEADTRFVSHVTALEIHLKNMKSPDAFPFSLLHLEQTMKEYTCTELPITYQDINVLGQMRFLHSDPFDRLLMAQARNRKIKLVTLDKDILRTFQRSKQFSVLQA